MGSLHSCAIHLSDDFGLCTLVFFFGGLLANSPHERVGNVTKINLSKNGFKKTHVFGMFLMFVCKVLFCVSFCFMDVFGVVQSLVF